MTVETYLYGFRMLARSIVNDSEISALYKEKSGALIRRRLDGSNTLTPEEAVLVRRVLFNEEAFRQKLEKKKRLYDRYIVKLSRACEMIRDERYRDFIVLHYVYDIPAEDIAERKCYAQRSVYRIGKQARKKLSEVLLSLSPKPKRTERAKGTRYAIKSRNVILCCSQRVNSGKNRKAVYPEIAGRIAAT